MIFDITSHPAYEQAGLAIDFLIVGGGIAGLSCALALRRVGHRVVVLEQRGSVQTAKQASRGGIRLPPNVSKILFHWGLEEALRAISVSSQAMEIEKYETGELLGTHIWEEEIIKEIGGEYLFCHHSDLWHLLLDAATRAGAEVHTGVKVLSVDCDDRHVRLSTGATLRADVIVGADGCSSLIQQKIAGKDVYGSAPTHCLFYNTIVPGDIMQQDSDLVSLYNRKHETMFMWIGHNASAIGFRVGGKDDFALHFWVQPTQTGPRDGDCWGADIDPKEMLRQLGHCEPRLLKLAQHATSTARVQVKVVPPLENWVHRNGRILVIGEAAHLLPAGSIQGGALAVEDSAVLAKLFSHLRSEDQIATFLNAFQDLREDRCASVVSSEQGNLLFQMMPHGPQQEQRDSAMRARYAEGRGLFETGAPAEQWEQIKELFGYDAEEQADDWWIKWGLLRERAKERSREMDEQMNARFSAIAQRL
ncbi:FAD/NAD(P)-binding domain-containing protein [Gyrodon lividus]|nr:FAD/NAD(P)-binding domain-containing protein [Gyrodon lividus]